MSSTAQLQPDPQPIVACTVSRDVQQFDLLIEDMEAALGETWGDLGFEDALAFLGQAEAEELQFIAIALTKEDEAALPLIADVIAAAKTRAIKVILIADEVSPTALHQLLREGGDEFVPYPLPEGELARAIERLRSGAEPVLPPQPETSPTPSQGGDRDGVVIPVQGMSGGSGATTLAVNLASELAQADKKNPPRVCLIDLDLQFGAVATALDLPRREAVLEILSDTASADNESFLQAMLTYQDRLSVLTSPSELVPLDLIGPADVERLIAMARAEFDYVVIDMPPSLVEWSETVLNAAHLYFATLELDMRSAQNTMRMKRALQGEDLPFDKLRFVLNRAPGFADLSGKSRARRLADSLGISIEIMLPDGGKPVTQCADQGTALSEGAPKNALRREIAKLARQMHKVNRADAAASR
ncbi:AAA family ATPase [Limimaricola pyoseonensis]|uniref:Pilus assembly protein CpaE n=1 Tax=Limimaricola pyoseonensis TaxID=521013 RepID=A0A1G7DDH1_9RHOB|nr:AAA family ATPase [Limimaricola pyoseonensis]SDE48835.1 pilus assembly protein CpaE [Limimaricola pyoseonensis]